VDTLNIIFLIVGTAISVIGILVGYKIAKKSGAFRKVLFDVYLMDYSLMPRTRFDEIIFGYDAKEHDIAICRLPFEITNIGELSAKNVAFTLSIPLALRCGGLKDNVGVEKFGHADFKRIVSIQKGFERVDYIIPEINPNSSAIINELIDVAHASSIPFKVDAVTKDGVPIQVKGHVGLSAQINVRLSATDVVPLNGCFKVRSYRVLNKEELGKEIMKDETRSFREKLSKIGVPKGVVEKAYASGVSKKTIVVMTKLKKITEGKYPGVKGAFYEEVPEKSERWLFSPNPKGI